MSKTDELKKLSEKLVGSAPDTRKASNVVEYIADQMSGDSENTDTISQSIAYLTKHVQSGGGGTSFDLENLPIVNFTGITPSTNQASVVGATTANLVYETTSYNKLDLHQYLVVETDPDGDLSIGLPLILYIAIDNKILPLRLRNAWQNEVDNDYQGFNVQEFWTDLTINNVKYTSGYLISGDHTNVRLELYS